MRDVAIVGMGCRFPGADGVTQFIKLLRQGTHAIKEMPQARLLAGDAELSAAPGSFPKGGFVDRLDTFDPAFFGMSQEEADHLDPQQRLLLEVSWQAFENAGIRPSAWRGSNTGVYIGATNADYHRMLFAQAAALGKFSASGTALGTAANRLSYFYDFTGPSLAVDTGCSSSLVALHQAVAALVSGEIDAAVVGGVNCILHPHNTVAHLRAGIISADNVCRSFDDGANGYVRSEGCGVVVLQRHEDALRDARRIWALIKATAVNHGGASNGFSAPNAQAQKRLINTAFSKTDRGIDQLRYVETHTTGTLMGDAVELKALNDLVKAGTHPGEVKVGSVKTNIGHLESASGMASLIKTACMAHFREFYPTLHFTTPNRFYKYLSGVLKVSDRYSQDPTLEQGLLGVSSFSFGGTNGFALLATARHNACVAQPSDLDRLLVVSAKSRVSLIAQLVSLKQALAGYAEADRPTLCKQYLGREAFTWRAAVVGASIGELVAGIEQVLECPEQHIFQCPRRRSRGLSITFEATDEHAPGHDLYLGEAVPEAFLPYVSGAWISQLEQAPLRGFLAALGALERVRGSGLFEDLLHFDGLGLLLSAYLEAKVTAPQILSILANQAVLNDFASKLPPSAASVEAPLMHLGTAAARRQRCVFALDDGLCTGDLAVALAVLWRLGHVFDTSGLNVHETLLAPLLPTYHFDNTRCWYSAS